LVLGTLQLVSLAGTETYVMTVARHLQRLGHQVTLWAPAQGHAADIARERGLQVAATERELPPRVDACIANSADSALDLAARFPDAPVVYVCHSTLFDVQVPPQLPGVVAATVALNDRTLEMATALAERGGGEPVRLRQPVDTEVFTPRGALRERPRRVLLLGNYLRGPRLSAVERAVAAAGAEAVRVGTLHDPSDHPEHAIASADAVIGKGRVIVEAMACGRPAYVLDEWGGDGWVTPASWPALEASGFAGRATDEVVDEARLTADLRAWSAEMGLVNRDLAVRHHVATVHAEALVGLCERVAGERRPARPETAMLREMARLVRMGWDVEGRALGLRVETESLHAALAAAEEERDRAARSAEDLEARAAEAQARLQKALALERAVAAFRATRRYRLAQALAAPLDGLRRRTRR
jgi:hypothetical protein